MKVKINREIEVPDKMICNTGRQNCTGLSTYVDGGDNNNVKLCANFNRLVWWSDKAGFYVRCDDCIQAHLDYLSKQEE